MGSTGTQHRASVAFTTGEVQLPADVDIPAGATGVVIFAHGSGSSRHSPRNRVVADALYRNGLATVLLDLLTEDEARRDVQTGRLRFDIGLLADRLVAAIDAVPGQEGLGGLPIGLFGASTGAAAALVAAAARSQQIRAVVSRGGRPDLAGVALAGVRAATLLVVGERDEAVANVNQEALNVLPGPRQLRVVLGAGHLFEEPGALDQVGDLAVEWFGDHLQDPPPSAPA